MFIEDVQRTIIIADKIKSAQEIYSLQLLREHFMQND